MISAELFKLRYQRTPWVLTAIAAIVAAGPAIYFAFKPPEETIFYTEVLVGVFGLAGIIIGAIFGGWLLGHEYSQSTLRRVAILESRRTLLLAKKLAAGGITFAAMLAAALGLSAAVTLAVASMHGDSLVMAGVGTSLTSGLVMSFASALLAFGLSAITRSSMYSMLAVLVVVVMFDPLLAMIPTVGPYMPGASITHMSDWIAGADLTGAAASTTGAVLAAIGWLLGTLLVGNSMFARQDI